MPKKNLNLFISFCGADKDLKNIIKNKLNVLVSYFKEKNIEVELVEMDTHCKGDWGEWMIGAVDSSDCVIPIITDLVIHADVEKMVYEEIVEARTKGIERIPFVITDDDELPNKYRANLNGMSYTWIKNNYTDQIFADALDELYNKVKRTLEGIVEGNVSRPDILPKINFSKSNTFIGREQELQEISDIFKESNVVILTGQGGIGKTALAKNFFFKNKDLYTKAYIIHAPNGIKDAIANNLHLNVYSSAGDLNSRFEENLNYLSELSEKTIIIIDNCDCDIKREELDGLRNMLCRFIITSRQTINIKDIVKKIEPMTDEDLIQMVYQKFPNIDNYNNATKQSLLKLFESVDRHTLTIEMAASVMKNGDYTIDEINEKLLEVTECSDETEHTDEKQTIMKRLSTLYNLADLTEEEKSILYSLTLISPLIGIERKELKELLCLENNNSINNLINNTFIRYNEENNTISLHPLFSDVIYKKENVKDLYNEFEVIINYIMDFAKHKSQPYNMLEMLEYVISKRKNFFENHFDSLGKLMWVMLNVCAGDSILDVAFLRECTEIEIIEKINFFEKSLDITKLYTTDDYLKIQNLYYLLGRCCTFLWKTKKANEKTINKAIEYYQKYLENPVNDFTHGTYFNLGMMCKELGDYVNAIKYFKESCIKSQEILNSPKSSKEMDKLKLEWNVMRAMTEVAECQRKLNDQD